MAKEIAPGVTTTIEAEYRHIEGYHVFTSKDVWGLYVARKDGRKAFEEVAPTIKFLLERNHGFEDISVEPEMTFAEFLKLRWPKDESRPKRRKPAPRLETSRFRLKAA